MTARKTGRQRPTKDATQEPDQPETTANDVETSDPESPSISAPDSPSIITGVTGNDAWYATQDLMLRIDGKPLELASHTGRPLAETAIAELKANSQFEGLVASGVLVRTPPQTIDRHSGQNRERFLQRISDVRNAA